MEKPPGMPKRRLPETSAAETNREKVPERACLPERLPPEEKLLREERLLREETCLRAEKVAVP
jgi:hypothetical protein